jgi:hypothetical protein
MSKQARQNILLFLSGLCFILAGLRDVYRPGMFTLNTETPNKAQVGLAMGLGLVLIGFAAFRILNAPKHGDGHDGDSSHH